MMRGKFLSRGLENSFQTHFSHLAGHFIHFFAGFSRLVGRVAHSLFYEPTPPSFTCATPEQFGCEATRLRSAGGQRYWLWSDASVVVGECEVVRRVLR